MKINVKTIRKSFSDKITCNKIRVEMADGLGVHIWFPWTKDEQITIFSLEMAYEIWEIIFKMLLWIFKEN